jgi:Uncharacterized protein conserved in bacteria
MRSAILAAAILLMATSAGAEDDDHVATVGDIRLVHAWARAADAGMSTLVFVDIDNDGPADRLTAVRSDEASGARLVGITLVDGEAGVREVGNLDVGPGETPLDPGGLAIELTGLTRTLAEGDETEFELTFEKAGTVHLHADVLAAEATSHPHAGHRH